MIESSSAKKRKLPKDIGQYFTDAANAHDQIVNVIQLSRDGIGQSPSLPRLFRAIDGVTGRDSPERIRKAEERAELARTEIEGGFPVLHSLGTVALWSWLEHTVKGLVVLWIIHDRGVLKQATFQRVQVKVSDFFSLNRRDQAIHLVNVLEQMQSSTQKHGVNRFESLLEAVYLSGPVEESVRHSLFELQQVRHVIAHQNGRCDQKLKTACPWLKLKIGKPVQITASQFSTYVGATMEYATELLCRVGDRCDVDVRGAVARASGQRS